ncbi:hypothetical protein F7U66_00325 [Vibrio parahaemolyticus]|nr:hypothetical protein [Vibrio parahaemolyticus]
MRNLVYQIAEEEGALASVELYSPMQFEVLLDKYCQSDMAGSLDIAGLSFRHNRKSGSWCATSVHTSDSDNEVYRIGFEFRDDLSSSRNQSLLEDFIKEVVSSCEKRYRDIFVPYRPV